MDFLGQANWQREGGRTVGCVCDFIKLSRSFLTLKAKVALETLRLPWSSNFASFVPEDSALGRHHLFTGLSTELQRSANNTVDTHF